MKKINNSILWEIKLPNGESQGLLFGTIHLNLDRLESKLSTPLSFLSEADSLFLEIDPAGINARDFYQTYQLEGNMDLKSFYSKRKYERIQKNCLKFCNIKIDNLKSNTPFYIINFIHQNLIAQDNSASMDMELYKKAMSLNVEVKGLIPVDEEFEVLKNMGNSTHTKDLYSLSRNLVSARKNINKLIDLYEDEYIHLLYRITKKQAGALRSPLLYERNFKMLECIKNNLISGQKILLAVGVSHLSGKYGLISLLRREGYKVQPFKPKQK
jgi:uncharacterized protein YbaP (TraB family)